MHRRRRFLLVALVGIWFGMVTQGTAVSTGPLAAKEAADWRKATCESNPIWQYVLDCTGGDIDCDVWDDGTCDELCELASWGTPGYLVACTTGSDAKCVCNGPA